VLLFSPKRRVLLWTRSAAMAQAFLLWALVATGTVQLWHVYVLALLLGLTNCLGRPAGQAFVVELVGRADLPNAVALNSSLSNLTRIVGPRLGASSSPPAAWPCSTCSTRSASSRRWWAWR